MENKDKVAIHGPYAIVLHLLDIDYKRLDHFGGSGMALIGVLSEIKLGIPA